MSDSPPASESKTSAAGPLNNIGKKSLPSIPEAGDGAIAASWTDGNPHPPVYPELLQLICNKSVHAVHTGNTP